MGHRVSGRRPPSRPLCSTGGTATLAPGIPRAPYEHELALHGFNYAGGGLRSDCTVRNRRKPVPTFTQYRGPLPFDHLEHRCSQHGVELPTPHRPFSVLSVTRLLDSYRPEN